jgi:hypothetical protein
MPPRWPGRDPADRSLATAPALDPTHHRMVKSWKQPGRYWLHKWPSPRAMASIRGKVRALTAPSRVGLDLSVVVEDLNPVLRGRAPTSGKATRRPSSARPTATSTNGWRGWPAGNTGFEGSTGQTASLGAGSATSGSTGSPGRCATRLRMRCGERCRRAVCRRTACTVRSGAAGEADVHGETEQALVGETRRD